MSQKKYMTKNLNIYLYLLSQLFSLSGSSVVDYVLIWFITIKTQSGIIMSVSMLATFFPRVLISFLSGFWVDKCNRKIIIGLSDFGIAIVSFILAIEFLLGNETVTTVLFLMFFRAIGSGLQSPCEKAFIVELAPEDDLLKINSWSSGILSAINLLSPIIGGILLTYLSMPAALSIDLVTAITAIIILPFIKRKGEIVKHKEIDIDINVDLHDIKLISFKKKIYVMNLFFCFFIVPVTYLSNLYIVKYYGAQIWRLTYNELVYGVGGLLGSLILSKNKFNDLHKVITVDLLLNGTMTILLALLKSYFIIYLFFIMFIAGVIVTVQILLVTLIQKQCPSKYHGRMFAGMEISTNTGLPLGMIFWGILSEKINLSFVFGIAGILLIILAFSYWRYGKSLSIRQVKDIN